MFSTGSEHDRSNKNMLDHRARICNVFANYKLSVSSHCRHGNCDLFLETTAGILNDTNQKCILALDANVTLIYT